MLATDSEDISHECDLLILNDQNVDLLSFALRKVHEMVRDDRLQLRE
jgi:hypothetical protein